MPISAVNLLIDSLLPEDLQDDSRIYDKKGTGALLAEVAKRYPEQYAPLSKALAKIGQQQVWRRGETFKLSDFKPVIDRKPFFNELDLRERELKRTLKDPDQLRDAQGALYGEISDRISKATNTAALASKNNIAITVLTGARGKDAQLRDLISTPGFYVDGRSRTIPGFIRNSYAEGLRPADYLAGTYAARSSVVESKKATAKGGFYGKTLGRAAATTYVTEPDCGTSNGISLPMEERDIRGRILQRDTAGFTAGTVIDRRVMEKLQDSKEKELIVRSPMTCQSEHGICAKCYGVMSSGKLPKVGEHVGYTSAQGSSEPIIQGALSMKHVTSASGPKTEFAGLDYLNQVTESPEEFKDQAVVTKVDGRVENIRDAPQGGKILTISGEDHYVPPDRFINVQKGQTLEAGDALTDGLMDPEDVMTYKGLGAARAYWADTMAKISKASGAGGDRRLFETLARAAVDHVDLDDPIEEGFLPDDRVRYSQFVLRRTPPKNVAEVPTFKAAGQYLEAPALHHTVGTKVTPSMVTDLTNKGFTKLQVSPNEPGFRPTFVRLTQVASTDDDWLASLGGSYLNNQLREGVMRAQDTNIEKSWHPVPRLAVGLNYADNLETTGKF